MGVRSLLFIGFTITRKRGTMLLDDLLCMFYSLVRPLMALFLQCNSSSFSMVAFQLYVAANGVLINRERLGCAHHQQPLLSCS